MAKSPSFSFYSSDFLIGTSGLTMEERGQYITILCLQHQKGNLSEKTISLLVGSVSVDVLNKFLKDENGNYFNERLRLEIEKKSHFIESRKKNGIKGGRPVKIKKDYEKEPTNKLMVIETESNLPVNKNEKTNEIPNEIEFLNYCSGILKEKYEGLSFSLKAKYKSWIENDWKDGNDKKIKNWKTKILNTIPFLKYAGNGTQQSEQEKRKQERAELNNFAIGILEKNTAQNY